MEPIAGRGWSAFTLPLRPSAEATPARQDTIPLSSSASIDSPSPHSGARGPGGVGVGSATASVAWDSKQPLSYAAALQDPSLAPIDPATIPVPTEIVDALKTAQTVLLIGHIGPDGDCVGSTLATARALEALGKTVDVCIDDHLPGFLRSVDSEQRVRRAADLTGKRWDVAMMMDVGIPSRIGGAVPLLQQAKTVAVVDHHEDKPEARDFFLRSDQQFLRWLEPKFPAAALQATAILARLSLNQAVARHVYYPALVGMITDTNWGQIRGLLPGTHSYFKHALQTSTWSFDEVRSALAFKIPQHLKPFVFGGELRLETLPPRLAERARIEITHGDGIKVENFAIPGWGHGPAVLMVSCSPQHFRTLLEIGRLDDPQFASDDLWLIFKELRDQRRGNIPLAIAAREYAEGTSLSLRSEVGDGALRLARELGGGGHKRAASGFANGLSLPLAKDMVVRWTTANKPWLDRIV